MKNELIKFETAKLAKEKGFDEECDYIWEDDIELQKLNYYNGGGSGVITNSTLKDDADTQDAICTVPTQSLLQRWLREVYKINVSTDPVYQETKKHIDTGIWFSNVETLTGRGLSHGGGDFKTYEEALEKGLQEALKLIKS